MTHRSRRKPINASNLRIVFFCRFCNRGVIKMLIAIIILSLIAQRVQRCISEYMLSFGYLFNHAIKRISSPRKIYLSPGKSRLFVLYLNQHKAKIYHPFLESDLYLSSISKVF